MRAMKSGATFFCVTTNVDGFGAFQLATSSRNDDAGDCIALFTPRSKARLKFADVTAVPSLNLKPFLIVKV